MNLVVLYPQPQDADQFEKDYAAHMKLLHEKTGIPNDAKPYTVTKFLAGPDGNPPFYRMFNMPFESAEALQAAMASPGMQEVAADAHRISSGGAPTILIGQSN
ncbi:EthD family reductase [Gaetbulibacter aestuarii]|uniref:EthD family reductase n=1 Tax=Gaetbulibacter aestuarii TaxID=1502358 RepID=A0ABW7MWT6_9FLAO